MATKKLRLLLATAILVFNSVFLFAQDAKYFSVTENGVTRFYQRLSWRGGEYALRYEVIIQRLAGGRYTQQLREFTTANSIEVSLPYGDYRFQVIPYDILNRPGDGTPWVNFEVRHAVQPLLSGSSPGRISSGGEERADGFELNVSGSRIDPAAEVFVRSRGGSRFDAAIINIRDDGNITVFVERSKLIPGDYELVIRNPGGLESNIGIVLPGISLSYQPEPEPEAAVVTEKESEPEIAVVTEKETEPEPEEEPVYESEDEPVKGRFAKLKPFYANYSLSWMPMLPLHGEFFGGKFSLLGMGLNFGIVFSLPNNLYIGPEFAGFMSYYDIPYDSVTLESNQSYLLKNTILSLGANLLASKWFANQKAALNFRTGVSFLTFIDTKKIITANIGTSVLVRLANKFFAELGVNYTGRFYDSSPDGSLRFSLGIGGMLF